MLVHITAQRHPKNMAAIRSKDTKPVMIVREGLWSRGFRYRLNSTKLLGHSDLVLRKCRTCIFVSDIWMNDHRIIAEPYPQFEEEEDLLKAAEEEI